MSIDFAAAMRRAAAATRALDVAEATRIIRQALGKQPSTESAPAARNASTRPAAEIEDAEIVPGRSGRSNARRRPLGEVVRLLREGRGRPAPRGPSPVPPVLVPDGARFEARSYRGAAGARDYRLYIPASAARKARGLVVMLHGCTQNPEDFAAGTGMNALAEARGLLVAYPQQTAVHNPNACWNWFRPEDQARGAGEPAIIAGLTEAVVREFAVPRERIFVAGLSAGGAMAAVLGETYPDLFAAVGVHSGLGRGAASDVVSAFAAMRGSFAPGPTPGTQPRMIVFHGDADATVHPSNAAHLLARAGGGPSAETERSDDGIRRRFTRSITRRADGTPSAELWMIEGAGHAWSGGAPVGSYTDPTGPDASEAMLRFSFRKPYWSVYRNKIKWLAAAKLTMVHSWLNRHSKDSPGRRPVGTEDDTGIAGR